MEHEAGRELDARIAERIFSYTLDYELADVMDGPSVPALRDQYDAWGMLPHYSTEPGDAWLVVEYMRANAPDWRAVRIETAGVGYMVAFYSFKRRPDRIGGFRHGETIALAICRAALAARGEGVENETTE